MQGECPDGMACETKRGYSQLKHCFTNFCLLLFKKKKKKSSSALLQLKRNLFSLRGANTNMTYFYFFPLFCCWLKNQFPVEAELWLQICRAAINNVTTEKSVSHKLKRRNASYLANWRVKSDLLHSSDFFFSLSVLTLGLMTCSLKGAPKHFKSIFVHSLQQCCTGR